MVTWPTAPTITEALAAAFDGVEFRVAVIGGRLTVSWVDGPNPGAVHDVIDACGAVIDERGRRVEEELRRGFTRDGLARITVANAPGHATLHDPVGPASELADAVAAVSARVDAAVDGSLGVPARELGEHVFWSGSGRHVAAAVARHVTGVLAELEPAQRAVVVALAADRATLTYGDVRTLADAARDLTDR